MLTNTTAISKSLGWWSNWGLFNTTSYAQSLDLDTSWGDYDKFYTRFFSGWKMGYADFGEGGIRACYELKELESNIFLSLQKLILKRNFLGHCELCPD